MMEAQSERGKEWLEQLMKLAGFPSAVTTEHHSVADEESQWLVVDHATLTSEQIEILIGTDGAVLDSIQYLANTILNLGQEKDNQGAFTIELAGYRARRQEELKAMAEQAAEQVRETGKEYELKSLSSAERRQIHTLLKECTDLETYSRGQEPDRRLVVRLLQN